MQACKALQVNDHTVKEPKEIPNVHLFLINLHPQSDWCPIIHEILRLHLQGAGLLPPTMSKVSQHVPHRQLCITLRHQHTKSCSSTQAVLFIQRNHFFFFFILKE